MNSPPFGPKQKTALPSYLVATSSPLSLSQEARDKKEREKLYAAIESSNTSGRQAVDLDAPNGYFTKIPHTKTDMNGQVGQSSKQPASGLEEERARDPRDGVAPP